MYGNFLYSYIHSAEGLFLLFVHIHLDVERQWRREERERVLFERRQAVASAVVEVAQPALVLRMTVIMATAVAFFVPYIQTSRRTVSLEETDCPNVHGEPLLPIRATLHEELDDQALFIRLATPEFINQANACQPRRSFEIHLRQTVR
jgi:hypothetical protein